MGFDFGRKTQTAVEQLLGFSRWFLVLAVIASVLAAATVIVMATLEVGHVVALAVAYQPGEAGQRSMIVASVVELVDGYLLAAVMIIFAIGLYSVFFGRISSIPPTRKGLLSIETLDDLKDRLEKAIMLVLFVKFFEVALKFEVVTSIDLLWLGLGTFAIAAALALSHWRPKTEGHGLS